MQKFLLFLISITLLTACSKDSLEDSIVGTWNLKSMTTECSVPSLYVQEGTIVANADGCITEETNLLPPVEMCLIISFSTGGGGLFIHIISGVSEFKQLDYLVDDDNGTARACDPIGFCLDLDYRGGHLYYTTTVTTLDQG